MNNNQQNKLNKEELGALWKKKSKSGMSFLSGYVKVDDLGLEKEVKIVVFANNKKANEKAPDYRIYISKPLDSNTQTQNADGVKTSKSKQVKPVQDTKKEQDFEEDEIL